MTHMWSEILEQPEVLKRCIESNEKTILSIVEAIKARNIDSVVIAARGTSDYAGTYAKYIIESVIGIPVALAAPSIYTVYGKKLKLGNSLVIGISQSGKAADVLEVIKGANESKALTLSITNDRESPLARQAQYHLFCDAGVEKSVAATKTFTSEMMLAAQLVAQWSEDGQIKNQLSGVPVNLSKVFEQEKDIINKVQRYRFISECFVLSRGINYPVALETALKFQETCYVRARAYATSDFYHGPFAMLDKDMLAVIYAPNGPSQKDEIEMINKIKESGAEVLIVSNNKELLESGNCTFEIPQTDNDMISPFYNVVIAQMLACRLSLCKGLNPDAPRGLNKVTITK
ncbi:glucosamine--fructose-6-phosphate aminotransferase (isomerizing) [Ruminiclostridium sufflavum DSM 19573]|uniref:Glucosamine--fructose-6-phosphate aminotransferase (Isomerizing) n=1 Tax=Ruminiclostridium sufflavum DSM 19573 TaxID=1121337 RepID=A0A318Y055_9FIRM|nr:SIS domain-containing protein [Ruminiclostridium sufflavum]PYG88714.1 glucosamine--fructose-6-phosphate aminotransferase (isomerizing) [Ruminiclostridium sufflavum DSM 19573]